MCKITFCIPCAKRAMQVKKRFFTYFHPTPRLPKLGKKCFSIQYILVTYQIKALGLVKINLGTKNFFEVLEPEKPLRRGWKWWVKNRFFTCMAGFAQGMQNVILHIYFILFQVRKFTNFNYFKLEWKDWTLKR